MPDDFRPSLEPSVPLAAALRALPLEAPPHSALPLLQERLRAKRRPRWPLALAASLTVTALALGLWMNHERAIARDPTLALQQQSQRLQSLWQAARDDGGDATYLLLSLQMEDELQAIDALLADRSLSTEQRTALWQRRVDTLRTATGFETTRDWLHANGQSARTALVMAD